MLESMTGYSSNDFDVDGYNFFIEIKSINNRFFDSRVKLPISINSKENEIKKLLNNELKRGFVEVYIKLTKYPKDFNFKINNSFLDKYSNLVNSIAKKHDFFKMPNISDIIKNPELISNNYIDSNFNYSKFFKSIEKTIKILKVAQKEEGSFLEKIVIDYINKLSFNINEIKKYSKDNYNTNYKKYFNKILLLIDKTNIDENRICTEASIMAEKLDITEEIDRFRSHLSLFKKSISSNCGRTLDFILQEINREINTISSKSSNNEISTLVIESKSYIEKIKEQVQNVK